MPAAPGENCSTLALILRSECVRRAVELAQNALATDDQVAAGQAAYSITWTIGAGATFNTARGLVSLCKTYERSFDTVEVQGSSPPCPRTVHPRTGPRINGGTSRTRARWKSTRTLWTSFEFSSIKSDTGLAQPPKENELCESRRLPFSQRHCCSVHLL